MSGRQSRVADGARPTAPEYKIKQSEVEKRAERKARKCAAALLGSLVLVVGAISAVEIIS